MHQLLNDFSKYARTINEEPHPFHVKSDWDAPGLAHDVRTQIKICKIWMKICFRIAVICRLFTCSSSNKRHLVAIFMYFPYLLATFQKRLCLSLKESKSHMLSILNFESSVTHRVVVYATLIALIAGKICHFCLFGKFCFLPKSRLLLLFAVFTFAFRTSKKNAPFWLFGYFAVFAFCLSRQQKKKAFCLLCLYFESSKLSWFNSK